MAIRQIVREGEYPLNKVSRPVEKFDRRLATLLDDMADTMYEHDGVGLAAVQVGILRRVFVVDVGDGLIEFVNPVINECEGEQTGMEGCLSCPGEFGIVTRPMKVKVTAQDRKGEYFTLEAEDFFARAICHEYGHLDGQIFKDIADRMLTSDELDEMREE